MAYVQTPCRLCGRPSELLAGSGDDVKIKCGLCGRYRISGSLAAIIGQSTHAQLRPYLSAHTRQQYEMGPVNDEVGSSPSLNSDNFESIARSHRELPVARKIAMLLEVIHKRTVHPGTNVDFSVEDDYPLLSAAAPAEALYYLRYLSERNLIDGDVRGKRFTITVDGWDRLLPIAPGGIPGTCFVAMSFDPVLDPIFDEGLRPAIEDDCGFKVLRVDRVEHNDNINDKIIADLRAAQFVVADFTQHRGGVYFEAGFALGLGRVVIWTCKESDFDKAHFDTKPYNHILWTSAADLRQKLTARIRATVSLTPKLK
jgi:hypothetical protein